MSNLKIENFRAIKNADIEIADFLVVIGEQASGKSTISKLVHYFKSLKKDAVDCLSEHDVSDKSSILTTQKIIFKARKRFHQLFGTTNNEEFLIEYEYDKGKTIKICQKKGHRVVLEINASWFQTDWYNLVEEYNDFLDKFGQTNMSAPLSLDYQNFTLGKLKK